MENPNIPESGAPLEQLFSADFEREKVAELVADYIFSFPEWDSIPYSQLMQRADVCARLIEEASDRTIPDLMALVDRRLPQAQAVDILRERWSQLFQEMDDEPSWEELQAWKTLLHAREYLENRP